MKKFIKENKIELIIMLVYICITFSISIFFHEKWRDEAQAWLMARDLNLVELLKQMKYEGHPFLWQLILMPFAKLGFPYITQNILSLSFMWIFAWLLLKKSPFKRFEKIIILLSVPIIYLYPVISRNYSLIPLALSIIAILYKERNEKKIQYILAILFLAYTHVLMWGLARNTLFSVFYRANKKRFSK